MQYGKHTALACGALLSAVLLLLPMGIGQTQARYEDTVSWKGIYKTQKPTLQSNFLKEGGRTVLLKDWKVSGTSYRTIGIQLAMDNGESSGALHCQVNSELITAEVDEESYHVSKTENHATLTLTATQQAQEITEPAAVTVRVSWIPEGQQQATAWADFAVTLLPQQDSVSDGGSSAGGVLEMICPETFSPEERLAIKLTLPEGTDRVVLSYDGGNFPENTCYYAGQETVLAEEMTITVPTEGMQETQVVLDFSWAIIYQDRFILSAAAYSGAQEIAATDVTVSTDREPLKVETASAAIVMGADAQVTLPIYGDSDGMVWTLEQLVQEDDKIVYTASNALTIETQNTDTEDATLVITNLYARAPAGTYRLTVQRVQNGAVLASFEIPVFICY